MERVDVADTEDTVWTEEAILALYGRHALQRNQTVVAVFFGIVILCAVASSLWYRYERTGDVDKLLVSGSCEGCDLYRTNLAGARLSGVNLSHAILRGADLSVADLSHADLRHADLSGASLFRANLTGADLRDANVAGTHLLFANLSGAMWVDGTPCSVFATR